MNLDALSQHYDGSAVTEGLLAEAKDGNQTAYEALFRRVENRLIYYIRARLGHELLSKMEVADIVQETYLEAHKDFQSFQLWGEGAFCRWLYGVAENCIRRASGRAKAAKRTAPKAVIGGSEGLREVPAERRGPVSEAQQDEQNEALVEALSKLSESSREILMLKYFQELSLEDMAQQLGKAKSTMQSRLARATLELGRVMKGKD